MAKRRPAGDGMVRKRDDGRWEGRIVIGHRENGEPLFRHVYAKTQKALLDKLHQNIECYRDVELTEDSRMTLGQWLDRWLTEYKAGTVRPGTLEGYRRYIEYYEAPERQQAGENRDGTRHEDHKRADRTAEPFWVLRPAIQKLSLKWLIDFSTFTRIL